MNRKKLKKFAVGTVATIVLSTTISTYTGINLSIVSRAAGLTVQYDNIGISSANNYVNIRQTPSTTGTIVGKLYRGAGATIISRDGEWIKVVSGTVTGYVHKDYLATGSAAEALSVQYGTKYAKVIASSLRVRQTNSTSATILGKVASGTKHEVLEEKDGWARINFNGQSGWISGEYVEASYQYKEAVAVGTSGTTNSNTSTNTGSNTTSTAVTGTAVAAYAKQFVGNPYVYGGTSLTNGADCSGFTLSIMKNFGITIPRTSKSQSTAGTSVSVAQRQPGDLIFYATNGVVGHVAVYIGDNKVVHASNSKTGIIISNYNYRSIHSVRRVIK